MMCSECLKCERSAKKTYGEGERYRVRERGRARQRERERQRGRGRQSERERADFCFIKRRTSLPVFVSSWLALSDGVATDRNKTCWKNKCHDERNHIAPHMGSAM